jgi:nitrogen-specific signal transduction histidine kinase
MVWQNTPFTAPLLVAAAAVLLAALYVVRQQRAYEPVPGGYLSVCLSIAAATALLVTAVRVGVVGTDAATLWLKATYAVAAPIPGLLFLFALRYTGTDDYLALPTAAATMAVPVAFAGLSATNGFHRLAWTDVAAATSGYETLIVEYGPFTAVFALYSGVVLLVSVALLGRHVLDSEGIYRRQATILVMGATTALAGLGVEAAALNPVPAVNVSLVGAGVAAFTISWGIARHGLFTLVPVASQTAVQQMDEAVIVIDVRGLVVNVNPQAEPFLTVPLDEATGQSVGDVLRPFAVPPAPVDASMSHREAVTDEETGRHYQRVGTPLTDDDDILLGELIVLRDITERTRREERLRQQNEQLEEFASVVSHDLRNPLNVISARTQLARETGDAEHFDALEDAADRMDRLIDDLLQLARQGQTVGETEEVLVREVAEDAWATVEAPAADFEIVGDEAVEADRDRLQQAFENLFRNAIDHVGEDVAIRVETMADGFAVEDDGPGIPPEERDEVFEYGHTTADDGTGFGLSIVSEIVDAHDWDIGVTDGERGGARFEITGIDTARQVSLEAAESPFEFE